MKNSVCMSAVLCLCAGLLPAAAGANGDADAAAFPLFRATYEVRISGFKVADSEFTLTRNDAGDYIYTQATSADNATSSSRWRYTDAGIRALEFTAHRDGGDGDDNVHLVFDWQDMRVSNRAEQKPWSIAMPQGTLDNMVMQLALLDDVKHGGREFSYPVATRGRIKTYRFRLAGEDRTELDIGTYRTLKLERTDDDKDKSVIWSAPELHYLPVRFVKNKGFGLKITMTLRDIEFEGDASPGGS